MRLETRTPSEPQLDNQRVGWIKVLGFVLFRFKSASLKNRTLLCYSDSHLTTQPNLRVIADYYHALIFFGGVIPPIAQIQFCARYIGRCSLSNSSYAAPGRGIRVVFWLDSGLS